MLLLYDSTIFQIYFHPIHSSLSPLFFLLCPVFPFFLRFLTDKIQGHVVIILNPEEQSLKAATDLILKRKTTLVFVLLTHSSNSQDGQRRMSSTDVISSIKVSEKEFHY